MSIRVALVEDTADIRNSLNVLIGGTFGFECVAACASGEEAMGAIPALHPDVVLMDIDLPGMSGIECMQRLREIGFAGQFMMLTVFMDDTNIFNALRAGANAYILKNTPPTKLIEALTELHAGGSPMTSQIARRVLETFQTATQTSPAGVLSIASLAALPTDTSQAETLTNREEEILQMLSQGLRYKAIAEKIFVSPSTVRTHIHNIYTKMHVTSRAEAVAKMMR